MEKPPYSPKFLERQRQRLRDERAGVLAGIDADEAELRSWKGDDNSGLNQHPADDATALTEQELDITLIDNARYILGEIDDALQRIEDQTYGWDEDGQCWIREERLEALPWARREVAGQRRLEERVRYRDEGYSHDTDLTSL
jgi:RNA polymerase-binding transcription factor DksA